MGIGRLGDDVLPNRQQCVAVPSANYHREQPVLGGTVRVHIRVSLHHGTVGVGYLLRDVSGEGAREGRWTDDHVELRWGRFGRCVLPIRDECESCWRLRILHDYAHHQHRDGVLLATRNGRKEPHANRGAIRPAQAEDAPERLLQGPPRLKKLIAHVAFCFIIRKCIF